MEIILRALNGKQLGKQYCFRYRNEKFIATLDYEGAVDYGWRDLIRIKQADNAYSNVFEFPRGAYNKDDGKVKYWNGHGFTYVKDFSDLVKEITDWIDFMM